MKRNSNKTLKLLSFFGIIVSICITTIGYSAFNANLKISGEAVVKADRSVRIVDLNISSVASDAYEQYNNSFNHKSIFYNIVLPNADSSITYKVDIKNGNSRDYGIADLTGLPDNLTYEFINYNVGDKVCTNSTCNNGVTDELYLKIKYAPNGYDSTNVNYVGAMNFEFEFFYNVLYKNVAGSSSLKQTILRNTTFTETIPIPEDYRLNVRMNGVLLVKDDGYYYDTNTNLLTVPNVDANLVISIDPPCTEYNVIGTGEENSFSFLNTGFTASGNTFFLEADFTHVDVTDVFENIISIGNDINNWAVGNDFRGGVNLHIYYPSVANTTTVEVDMTYRNSSGGTATAKAQRSLSLAKSKLFRLAFNENGLYINGLKILDSTGKGANVTSNASTSFLNTYFGLWSNNELNIDIGSMEGNNRSNAVYHRIEVYDSKFTVEELINITNISTEEIPIYEDLIYESASMVNMNNQNIPVVYPFQPNNNKFIFKSPDFADLTVNSLYLEIDVSNLKENANLENLISLGNDFSNWNGENVFDFHVFYPYTSDTYTTPNTLSIALLVGSDYGQYRNVISLIDNRYIKMLLTKEALYINGEMWISSTGYSKEGVTAFGNNASNKDIIMNFFDKFTNPNDPNLNFIYGSTQGNNRSSATYNDVRIYSGVFEEADAINLTS